MAYISEDMDHHHHQQQQHCCEDLKTWKNKDSFAVNYDLEQGSQTKGTILKFKTSCMSC
jgi:hypothetical protein